MTRLRIALVSLAVALSLFAPAVARPAEVQAANDEVATVFAFDFSGSIFCLSDNKPYQPCTKINVELAEAVEALAERINVASSTFADRKMDFKVTVFGGEGRFKVVKADGQRCVGNTSTKADLLVECLREVGNAYRDKSNQMWGTGYAQTFDELDFSSDVRCGLILFTDGEPNDKSAAEREANRTACAVLPVSTGAQIDDETKAWLKDIFTQEELVAVANCSDKIAWKEVYFSDADLAANAIETALEEIACLASIPSYDLCKTVDELVEILRNEQLQVRVEPGVIGSEFPVGFKLPGQTVGRDEELVIEASTPTRPESCADEPSPTPDPTVPPPPPPPPPPPCIATFPSIQWLGCNLWVLALLALAIILRLVWIGLDLQVSINGKPNVGLRGGRMIGFNIQDAGSGAAATRTPNPTIAQVKVSRAFFRFLPGTVIDRTGLNPGPTAKGNRARFSLGEKVELKPGVVAVFSYGNPSRKPSASPVTGSRVSSSEQKPRNKAL
jgi:hypothetical protein